MNLLVRRYGAVMLLVGGAFLLTGFVQFGLIKLKLIPTEASQLTSLHLFIMVAIQAVLFILLAQVFAHRFELESFDFRRVSEADSLGARDFLQALLGLLVVYIVAGVVVHLLGIEVEQYKDFDKALLREQGWIFIATVSVIAPFYEEYFFRGLILRSLLAGADDFREQWPRIVMAILATSGLFAAMHIQSGVSALIPIFLLSLYLCVVALYKRNIRLSIFVHATHNLMAGYLFLHFDPSQLPNLK